MLVPRALRRRRPEARTLSHDGLLLVSLRSRRGCDSSCPFRQISDLARCDRVRCRARGDPAACYSGRDPSTAEAGYPVIPIGNPDDSPPDWEHWTGRRLKLRDLRVLAEVACCGSMAQAATQLAISQPAESEFGASGSRLPERSVKAASLPRRTKLLSTGCFILVMHAPILMQNAQTWAI
jgi:hypothetical protein